MDGKGSKGRSGRFVDRRNFRVLPERPGNSDVNTKLERSSKRSAMTIQVQINLDMHPTSLDLFFPDGIPEGGRIRLKLQRASSRFAYLNEREHVPVVRQNRGVLDTRYLEENIVLHAFHEDDGHPLCILKPIEREKTKSRELRLDVSSHQSPDETQPTSSSASSPTDGTFGDAFDDVLDTSVSTDGPSAHSVPQGRAPIYLCSVCGYQTKDKEQALEHMRDYHASGTSQPMQKEKRKLSDATQNDENESGKKSFKCAECSKQFPADGLLKIHSRVYHGPEIKCAICYAQASNERDLEKHMVSKHRESAPLKCSVCSMPHFNPEILESHQLWCSTMDKLKRNLKCQLCNFRTIQYDTLCQHVKDSHTEKAVYTCQVCGSLSLDAKLHHEHVRTHREAPKPAVGGEGSQCPICRKPFTNKRGLRAHLKRHPISLIHVCQTCGETMATQQDLLQHVELHHKPSSRRYQCRFCNNIFKTSFSVKRHMKKQHGYERPSPSVPWDYITLTVSQPEEDKGAVRVTEAKPRPRRPHRCERCSFETNSLDRFERHQALHTGKYPYSCPECPRRFAARGELKKHNQIAHPKDLLSCTHCPRLFQTRESSKYEEHLQQHRTDTTRPCQECGHHFADAEELLTHLDQFHSPSLPIECRLCHQRFRVVNHRVNHVRRYHPNVLLRPHVCDICGWAYRYQSGLSVHKLERHSNRTGDKTYECNYCGKVFGRGNILALHLRLHTGESPYLCRECGVTFRTPTGLKYHTVNVHTKDYSVFCQICSKGFVSRRKLKVHLMRTHKAQNVVEPSGKKGRAPPVFVERATVPVVSSETGDDSMLDVMRIVDPDEGRKTGQVQRTIEVIDISDLEVAQTSTVECYVEA